MEFGWKYFVDNLKNWVDGWKNCDGNLKIWVDDWNVGSDLNGLTLSSHCYFGSIRNSGDFSNQNCTLVHKDYCSALKRLHSSVQVLLLSLNTGHSSNT